MAGCGIRCCIDICLAYVSPHPLNLRRQLTHSIRVTGPHDDEDWLIGESVDGSRTGGFPKVCQQHVLL